MKVSELKKRKKELGYTNEMIAELSGVPLGTVQKVMGGTTASPRYETVKKIEKALFPDGVPEPSHSYYADLLRSSSVTEPVTVRESGDLAYYGYNNRAYAGKKQGEYTVDDWYAMPEGFRMELIDGKLYDMAPPTYIHQYLVGQVHMQLSNAISASQDKKCMALVAPVGVQLFKDDKNMLEPDIIVVCDKTQFRKGVIYGAPELVIEVLSPSTGGYDRVLKLNKYWEGGVREYWIIDPRDEKVYVYFFESGMPPVTYSFYEEIPVNVSDGRAAIDFRSITETMHEYFGNELE